MTETKPFWETDHPYVAPDSNYYANGYESAAYTHAFDSWSDFLAELGDMDEDYNFLYRWDFYSPDPKWAEKDEVPELHFCYILQRKGTFLWAKIRNPQPEDEEAIRAYLDARWDHVRRLWAPLSGVSG